MFKVIDCVRLRSFHYKSYLFSRVTHSSDPNSVHGIFEYLEDRFLFLDKLGRENFKLKYMVATLKLEKVCAHHDLVSIGIGFIFI